MPERTSGVERCRKTRRRTIRSPEFAGARQGGDPGSGEVTKR